MPSAEALSRLEAVSSRPAAPRTFASPSPTERSNRAMVEALAFQHRVAEHDDRSCHRADLVAVARRRNPHRGFAGGKPPHSFRQAL
jgi:hypothetical protein